MPYIKQSRRRWAQSLPQTPGELNFAITKMVLDYLARHEENYAGYNDCLGALEGAKLELYRRRVAPYEDEKIKENGDVY